MHCDDVTERLPWLLNGTLETAERQAVTEHLQRCPACRAELSETRQGSRLFGAHVPSENLVDYGLGREAVGIPRAILEQHLAQCASCREELALVQSAPAPEEGPAPRESRSAPGATPWRRVALAASIVALVALVALGARVTGPGVSPRPEANVAVVELLPESLRLRGAGDAVSIDRTRPASLILVTDRVPGGAALGVRILDQDGKERWQVSGVTPTESGELTLLLPAGSAPAGVLTVELLELDSGKSTTVETYRIELRP